MMQSFDEEVRKKLSLSKRLQSKALIISFQVVNPTNTGTEFEFLSMKAYQVSQSFQTQACVENVAPDTNAS